MKKVDKNVVNNWHCIIINKIFRRLKHVFCCKFSTSDLEKWGRVTANGIMNQFDFVLGFL